MSVHIPPSRKWRSKFTAYWLDTLQHSLGRLRTLQASVGNMLLARCKHIQTSMARQHVRKQIFLMKDVKFSSSQFWIPQAKKKSWITNIPSDIHVNVPIRIQFIHKLHKNFIHKFVFLTLLQKLPLTTKDKLRSMSVWFENTDVENNVAADNTEFSEKRRT